MGDFFKTLERLSGDAGNLPTFLSTHPDPANRYNKVHEMATEAQAALNKENLKIGRDSYLRMIDGLKYGEDPRQGFVEGNYFYHPDLKFYYPIPNNWVTQNSQADVRMAPQNGKALMILMLSNANSLDAAAQASVNENQLTVVESAKQTVNGFPALIMIADQVNAQDPSQVIRVMSYFIQDGGNIYVFHGLSMRNDFSSYANTFQNTMGGFRRLTDSDKLNRQPDHLRVVGAPKSGTLQSALEALKVPSGRMQEFAILNGMELNDQVSSGTLLKVLK
jgi:predicted Zn-dependent protease